MLFDGNNKHILSWVWVELKKANVTRAAYFVEHNVGYLDENIGHFILVQLSYSVILEHFPFIPRIHTERGLIKIHSYAVIWNYLQ